MSILSQNPALLLTGSRKQDTKEVTICIDQCNILYSIVVQQTMA